jgi:hypothetical protein
MHEQERENGKSQATRGRKRAEKESDQQLLLQALMAMREGDFSARLPGDWTGLSGKIADTFNEIISTNARLAAELERVGDAVGKRGRTSQRVKCGMSRGAWGEME